MASKKCAICGKPSGMYPLCNDCFKLRDEGKVTKCEECGTWHYTNEKCPNCKQTTIEEKHDEIIITEDEPLSKCILCGQDANGYLFCKDCYYKYKDKELLVKITKCSKIEVLDDSYEGRYKCKDGHVVKSKSEKVIDDYLFISQIPHAYEKSVPIDDNKKNDLHPDFYLPSLNAYIEHWGYDETNKPYTETKEYKITKYKEKGITIICTNEKDDMGDIDAALERKLANFKKGEINFL